MRQAIVTKFAGPTNHRGSRVIASAEAGRVTVPWDHALSSTENHRKAAEALCKKFGWEWALLGGGMPTGNGYAWVDAGEALSAFADRARALLDASERSYELDTEAALVLLNDLVTGAR